MYRPKGFHSFGHTTWRLLRGISLARSDFHGVEERRLLLSGLRFMVTSRGARPPWAQSPSVRSFLAGQRPHRRGMFIQTSSTPNPNSVKFLPGTVVMENDRTFDFASFRAASASPLARQLFQIDGVIGVMYGPDFITVSKREDADWSVLRPEIFSTIMDFFVSGDALFPAHDADAERRLGSSDTEILDSDPEHIAMIKELIETRIKPAVAEDGGSIVYRGFEPESGTVLLEMQGACSSCASSSVTLKNGVENMLCHYIPEVKGVREVKSDENEFLETQSLKELAALERQLQSRG